MQIRQVSAQGLKVRATGLPYIAENVHRAGTVASYFAASGIGLAASRRILEQHGGAISQKSQEGDSAMFRIRVPFG